MREGIRIIEDLKGTLSIAFIAKPKHGSNLIELPINLYYRDAAELERDVREMHEALSLPRLQRNHLGHLIDPGDTLEVANA